MQCRLWYEVVRLCVCVARLMRSGESNNAWTVAGKAGRKENVASNRQMANGGEERRWAGPKTGGGGGPQRRMPRMDAPATRAGGSGSTDVNSLRDAVAHARSGTGEVKQAIVSATFSPRAPCFTALLQQCSRTKSWCALMQGMLGLLCRTLSRRSWCVNVMWRGAGKRRLRCFRQCARLPE